MPADIINSIERWCEQGFRWLTQDRHKQKAIDLRDQMERAFTDHPKETGETYLKHLWFTVKMTSRMVFTALLLFIHGMFPFLLTRAASTQFEKMYQILRSRIPEARRNQINSKSEP